MATNTVATDFPVSRAQLDTLKQIARRAGTAIMQVYDCDDFQVQHKGDNSPLTAADLAAHKIIDEGLARLTPELPRLSEEAADIDFASRKHWHRYWCIDPLDGTKEFINRNGEFTVNIALIDQHRPIFGLIYLPVTGELYWNDVSDTGVARCWKQHDSGAARQIHSRPLAATLTLIASRRHGQEKNAALLGPLAERFSSIETVNRGSSLKMCLIAEGKADLYPRLFPTSEWDTAASQAIIEAAGGWLLDAQTLQPLRYNQRESLENPWFIVVGDRNFPLAELNI
ncbi:MAG: 3'(2'),5'-bisphosphate nucleotidase CysQ [Marinobacterium sp.]|nr:3'(2'),5'-bisphosphate nucleotidase CysQ [Marinobacterium sp.]